MKNSRLESLDAMTRDELLEVASGCDAEKGRNHCWRCEAWARYVDWDKDHREPVVIEPPQPKDLEYLIEEALDLYGHIKSKGDDTWVNVESLPAIIEYIASTGHFMPVAMG